MQEVYLVDGARTPFIKATGRPSAWRAADLAVASAKPLLLRQSFPIDAVDEVIYGCVGPSSAEVNIGRIIGLRVGCKESSPGYTVQRNCASGLQAIDSGYKDIAMGRHDIVLAGGTEAMSHASLLFSDEFVLWFAKFMACKTVGAKLKQLSKLKAKYFIPVISLLKALNDPVVNLSMGQTAEKLAFQYNISRIQSDEYSLQSHQRAAKAIEMGYFTYELVPLFDFAANAILNDTGIRLDSSIEKLSSLKPAFDKPFGQVTPGNSSQISDGAASVILASKDAVKKYNLKPLAKIVDFSWQALDPSIMGLGPALNIKDLLTKRKLKLADIDYVEINEAFAAQVLSCVEYLKQNNVGTLSLDKLNVDGGAIAIGHPVGASGARLALHLAHVLKRNNAKYGIASLCIGGGQGGGVLLENIRR